MPEKIHLKKAQFFYIISFPRSGNTWMVNSLKDFLGAQRTEVGDSVYKGGQVLVNNAMTLSVARGFNAALPLGIKTHKYPDEFKIANCIPSKVVYLLRDPRDVMISYYFYQTGFIQKNVEKSSNFDGTDFMQFLKENLADYARHVNAWQQSEHQIITVRYEDLKRNYEHSLNNIQEFLDLPAIEPIEKTKERHVDNFTQIDGFKHVLQGNNMDFYRKGIIGDWENYFESRHLNYMHHQIGELMLRLGYT